MTTNDARARDEEQHLLALAAARPWDAALMLKLGRLQASLLKYPEAASTLRRAIVLAPDDPEAWITYATHLIFLHEGEISTDQAFNRAAKVSAGNPAILEQVINFFAKDEKPEIALHYIQQSLDTFVQTPRMQLCFLASLLAVGRSGEAADHARGLVAGITNLAATQSGLQRERLLLHRALVLQAAGLDEEIHACLEDCARLLGAVPVQFDGQPGLLPNSAGRVASLQAQMRGRDAFVFLPGPSAKDFAENARSVADWDFVSVGIAGHIDAVERTMLEPLGRHLDLLWMSNPAHMRVAEASITPTLERGPGIRLLAQEYSFLGYPRFDAFMERFASNMLWVNCLDQPPSPSAPLKFLVGNSMCALLQILIWGQPSRIFLIGADGGATAPNSDDGPYFFTPSVPAGGEVRDAALEKLEIIRLSRLAVDSAARRFRLEAKEADEMVGIVLRIFRTVFGLRIPKIYNCSPYSAHNAFEKITLHDALAMKP